MAAASSSRSAFRFAVASVILLSLLASPVSCGGAPEEPMGDVDHGSQRQNDTAGSSRRGLWASARGFGWSYGGATWYGSPYGAGTFAGDGSRWPTEVELEHAFHQGKYFAGIAKRLKGGSA